MRSIQLLFGLMFLVLVLGCGDEKKVKVLRLAHGLDITHPVHKGMEFMATKLEEKSGGKMQLAIYPSGQLGAERECLELLQIGSLDLTKVSAAVLENFAPGYEVLSLPYIFRNREHRYAALDGVVGQQLLDEGEKYRLKGLCFYDAGSRSFYTKGKPVQTPGDLRGLKIRVQKSKTAVNMIEQLGGSPTPIAWGELYTALQQGVVDGAENNPPSFFFSRHYEVCKFYTINEHTSVPDVLIVGTSTWKSLTPEQQGWLKAAAMESAIHQRVLWQASEQECLAAVKEAGVEIVYPPKEPFAEKVRSMYDDYREQPEMMELIEQIKAVKSTTRP
ncbi:TRAP transporter substrate-binding protein [Fulvivirga sp. M361]|nr:TRAP transporter substrate-binding protein [Fulvivirga sp. M361]